MVVQAAQNKRIRKEQPSLNDVVGQISLDFTNKFMWLVKGGQRHCWEIQSLEAIFLNSLIFFFFREGEERGEREIDLFYHLFMHSLVDSCMCPNWGWNPQTCPIGMML